MRKFVLNMLYVLSVQAWSARPVNNLVHGSSSSSSSSSSIISSSSSSSMITSSKRRVVQDPRMESLASKMFGDVFGGLKSAADQFAKVAGTSTPAGDEAAPKAVSTGADEVVSGIDRRAASGEVSFEDFLTMSSAFAKLGGKGIPGMPTLTDAQLAETKQKFLKHEKIVEVMLEDERANPEMLIEDLKSGGARPGPRIQRLAVASGQPETEVGLFLMQFEAMRESTRRIAAGEDPDEVNESMATPPGANRAAKRAAAKRAQKAKTKK